MNIFKIIERIFSPKHCFFSPKMVILVCKQKCGEKMKRFNYSNLKDKKWDIKIINYLSQIHEEKGKQQLLLKYKVQNFQMQ